jgi:hypothetical protein
LTLPPPSDRFNRLPDNLGEIKKSSGSVIEFKPRPTDWDPYGATRFAQMPKHLMRRKEVSSDAKLVYAALVDAKGDKKLAWPSRKALAEACGLTVDQVARALAELKKLGLIRAERRGMGKTNLYTFLPPQWVEQVDYTRRGNPDSKDC